MEAKPYAFGNWLRSAIAVLYPSQGAFADAIGVSRTIVTLWITGKRIPTAEHMSAIAHATGTETSYLIDMLPAEHRLRQRALPTRVRMRMSRINWTPSHVNELTSALERIERGYAEPAN